MANSVGTHRIFLAITILGFIAQGITDSNLKKKIPPKDLRNLSNDELNEFFNSFDTVVTDIDGVLFSAGRPTPKALEVLRKLQQSGKKIIVVTNNSLHTKKHYIKSFKTAGVNICSDDLVLPSTVLAGHLRSIQFSGSAFVFGESTFIKQLDESLNPPDENGHRQENVKFITGPGEIETSARSLTNLTILIPNLRAIIMEYDTNMNQPKLTIAANQLRANPELLFFVGATESTIPLGPNKSLIGPGEFVNILSRSTNRTPEYYLKPSKILTDYLSKTYHDYLKNPERVIFFGDTQSTDMEQANLSGFRKLWVSSGTDSVESCINGCDVSPNYYLPSLVEMPTSMLNTSRPIATKKRRVFVFYPGYP